MDFERVDTPMGPNGPYSEFERVDTPMGPNGPYSELICCDDTIYKGWIDSRFIFVHKSILVIT